MAISDFSHLTGKRVYIETYGCRYTFGDTSKLQEILKYQGCTLVQSEEDAEAVIINTGTVVAATERRMLSRISRFRDRVVSFIVTERIRTGSVMARTPSYLGVVLREDLTIGFTGHAVIEKEHMYFFSGKRRMDPTGDR